MNHRHLHLKELLVRTDTCVRLVTTHTSRQLVTQTGRASGDQTAGFVILPSPLEMGVASHLLSHCCMVVGRRDSAQSLDGCPVYDRHCTVLICWPRPHCAEHWNREHQGKGKRGPSFLCEPEYRAESLLPHAPGHTFSHSEQSLRKHCAT